MREPGRLACLRISEKVDVPPEFQCPGEEEVLQCRLDLLFLMVKRKNYFLNPISCQNFANAFAETPNLNLEVRHM